MNKETDIIKIIEKREKYLRDIKKSVKTIAKLSEKDPIDNLYTLKKELKKIEETSQKSESDDSFNQKSIVNYIASKKTKLSEWEAQLKKEFGSKLERLLKKSGYELRGSYPLLKVLFYTLEIKFENDSALIWYGPQQEKVDTCRLNVEEISQKIKRHYDHVIQHKFDEKNFLSTLYKAYRSAANRTDVKVQLPISEVLFDFSLLIQDKKFKSDPVKKNFKEYGRINFSYDLFRLKSRIIDNYELTLVTATQAFTQRKSDFMWIPNNLKGDGTSISHIKFTEVKR